MSSLVDLSLLRVTKYRDEFFRLRGRIPAKALDPQTMLIMDAYERYFNTSEEAKVVDPAALLTVFRAMNPDMSEDSRMAFESILGNIKQDVTDDQKTSMMNSLLQLRMATDFGSLLIKYEQGDIANLHAEMQAIEQEYINDANIKVIDFIRPDLKALLEEAQETAGYQWRLHCLRATMRNLRGGDFGVLAGRPDKGKTTFLASELTHLATQVPAGRCILWLNNEGKGDRIYLRLVQAALGLPLSGVRELSDPMRDYSAALNTEDPYKIRIVDIHGKDTYTVENLIRANNPAIVVFDMIDNIRGFQNQSRTDQVLEEMYKWARELCVKHDFVGLATSQISNEGDNLSFPSLGMLKDSKTGKQGACDFQLMIGALNDPAYDHVRYISLPKNKLRREGADRCPRATVTFQPQIARFTDVEVETVND